MRITICQIVLLFFLYQNCISAQTFPETITGWKRIDSTTHFENSLRRVTKLDADLLHACGFKKVSVAQYQQENDVIEVQLYEMFSTRSAFEFFSTRCADKLFEGTMGNAAYLHDSVVEIDYGSYYAFIELTQRTNLKELPKNFLNGVFDIMAPISDLEIIRTAFPLDERKAGSERYCGSPVSWKKIDIPSLKSVMNILEKTHAFIARYVKERMNIVRTLISFVDLNKEDADILFTSLRNIFLQTATSGRKHKMIEGYIFNATKIYLVNAKQGVFLAVAQGDDPGAFGWLADEFAK